MQSNRVFRGAVTRWLAPLGLTALAAGSFFGVRALEGYNRSLDDPLLRTPSFHARVVTLPSAPPLRLGRAGAPVESKLLRGETAANVFGKLGLAGVELREATNALAARVDLRSLKAGNRYAAFFNPDASLASFEMTLDGSGRVEMIRQGSVWRSDWEPFQRRVE